MSLTKCTECGFEVTIKTDICLNCGEKIHKISGKSISNIVKRIVFILFALYMLLSGLNFFELFKK